jgi:uncharacterized protein YndB with AHSA1/START domain
METLPKVERTVELDASPDEVWRHLVSGELASLWMGGEMAMELRRGGRVTLRTPGSPEVFGTVEELSPGRSIIWTWRTAAGEPTQVVIRLQEYGEGCRLEVSEEMLAYEIVQVPPIIG